MAELIDKGELVKAVRESRKNNTHTDGSIARNHDMEHYHFLSLISRQPTTTEADIRAMAIDEFLEKISLEISESIIWDMVVTAHRNGNCSETSDEIVEYVLDTVREVAEQLKEE